MRKFHISTVRKCHSTLRKCIVLCHKLWARNSAQYSRFDWLALEALIIHSVQKLWIPVLRIDWHGRCVGGLCWLREHMLTVFAPWSLGTRRPPVQDIVISATVLFSIQSSGARQLHCFRAAGAASPSCARNQSPHTLPVSYTLSDRHRSIIFDIIIVVIIVMIIVIIIVTTSVISVIATIIVIIVLICAQPSPNLRCAVISPKLSSHYKPLRLKNIVLQKQQQQEKHNDALKPTSNSCSCANSHISQ